MEQTNKNLTMRDYITFFGISEKDFEEYKKIFLDKIKTKELNKRIINYKKLVGSKILKEELKNGIQTH